MRRRLIDVLSRLAASAPADSSSSSSNAGAAVIIAAVSSRVASGALASTSAEARKPAAAAAALKIASRRFASSSSQSRPPPSPATATATHAPPCWSCGEHAAGTARPSLICGSCRAVQPLDLVFGGDSGNRREEAKATRPRPPPPDPFSLLGLPRSFDVDPKALEASYRALQAQLHPDKHHHYYSSDQRDRASLAAAEASAAVNAAVALLRCPLARARFLLDGTRPDRDDEDPDETGKNREVFDC